MVSNRIVRIAGITSVALVLALGTVPSRSQIPDNNWTFDGEWEQCFQAATRMCVLRYAARVADSIEDPHPRVERLASIAEAQFNAALATEAAATLERARQLVSSIAGERD